MCHTSPLAQLCSQSASVARKPLLVVTFTPPALSVRQPSRSPISANGIAWTVSPFEPNGRQRRIRYRVLLSSMPVPMTSRAEHSQLSRVVISPVSLSDLGSTQKIPSARLSTCGFRLSLFAALLAFRIDVVVCSPCSLSLARYCLQFSGFWSGIPLYNFASSTPACASFSPMALIIIGSMLPAR
ncbi:Uncharacterised protein [Klebsiella pneumoniae]|nr:Uncharacterised protein [Klebsiella pneumoniae]